MWCISKSFANEFECNFVLAKITRNNYKKCIFNLWGKIYANFEKEAYTMVLWMKWSKMVILCFVNHQVNIIKRWCISPFLDTSVVNSYYWVSAWMSSCMWQENIDKEFGCPMDACIVKVSHSFKWSYWTCECMDIWLYASGSRWTY